MKQQIEEVNFGVMKLVLQREITHLYLFSTSKIDVMYVLFQQIKHELAFLTATKFPTLVINLIILAFKAM